MAQGKGLDESEARNQDDATITYIYLVFLSTVLKHISNTAHIFQIYLVGGTENMDGWREKRCYFQVIYFDISCSVHLILYFVP